MKDFTLQFKCKICQSNFAMKISLLKYICEVKEQFYLRNTEDPVELIGQSTHL